MQPTSRHFPAIPWTGPVTTAPIRRPAGSIRASRGLSRPFPGRTAPLVAGNRAGFLPWRAEWDGAARVFLGLDGDQPLFAVDMPGESEPQLEGGAFQEMRAAAFVLPGRDTAIAGQAKALLDWHSATASAPTAERPRRCGMAVIAAPVPVAAPSIFPAPIRW